MRTPTPTKGVRASGLPSDWGIAHAPQSPSSSPMKPPGTVLPGGLWLGAGGEKSHAYEGVREANSLAAEEPRRVDAGVCVSRLPSDWSIDQLLQSPPSLLSPRPVRTPKSLATFSEGELVRTRRVRVRSQRTPQRRQNQSRGIAGVRTANSLATGASRKRPSRRRRPPQENSFVTAGYVSASTQSPSNWRTIRGRLPAVSGFANIEA